MRLLNRRRSRAPASPDTIGVAAAQWAAGVVVVIVAALLVSEAVRGVEVEQHASVAIPLGSAMQLLVFAAVVVTAVRGWTLVARWLSVLGVLLSVVAVAMNSVRSGAFGVAPTWVSDGGWWLPAGQASGIHLLLGLALFASLRPGRGLAVLRAFGLAVAGLGLASSMTAHALGSSGYALIPGLVPMSNPVTLATIAAAFGIVGSAPNRWPTSMLIQRPSDRVMVSHMLPFIVVTPLLLATVRYLGAGHELLAVLVTVLPVLALFGVTGVAVHDHRQLVEEIRSRDSQLLTVLDGLPIAVMLRAKDGTLLHLNPEAERFVSRVGVELSAVSGSASGLLDHVEVVDEAGRPYLAQDLPVVASMRNGTTRDATVGFELPEGGRAWYSVRAAPVPLSDGTTGTTVTLDDVTEQQAIRHQVAVAERSLRLTFEHAPIGIAVIALDGQLLQVNPALCELLGYQADTDLLAGGLQALTHPDERDEHARLLSAWSTDPQACRVDRRFRHRDGNWIYIQMSIAVVRNAHGAPLHLIAQLVDLTERRSLEQELRTAAAQDPLTGLVNRRALAERLAAAQLRQERDGGKIGLVFLDLDDFKSINDNHGHEVGDRMLIETGRQMLAATRRTDTVCRMGGDEFVVLCAPIDGRPELRNLVERLTLMGTSVLAGEVSVPVGRSIGAILVEPGEDLEVALRRADAEMYRQKRQRPSRRVRLDTTRS